LAATSSSRSSRGTPLMRAKRSRCSPKVQGRSR
jgi:hypothetical protein